MQTPAVGNRAGYDFDAVGGSATASFVGAFLLCARASDSSGARNFFVYVNILTYYCPLLRTEKKQKDRTFTALFS